jgi:hypothetical protein
MLKAESVIELSVRVPLLRGGFVTIARSSNVLQNASAKLQRDSKSIEAISIGEGTRLLIEFSSEGGVRRNPNAGFQDPPIPDLSKTVTLIGCQFEISRSTDEVNRNPAAFAKTATIVVLTNVIISIGGYFPVFRSADDISINSQAFEQNVAITDLRKSVIFIR